MSGGNSSDIITIESDNLSLCWSISPVTLSNSSVTLSNSSGDGTNYSSINDNNSSRKRKNGEISTSSTTTPPPLSSSSLSLSSSSSSLNSTCFPITSPSSRCGYLSVIPSTSLYAKLTMTTGNEDLLLLLSLLSL
jgi:hypothetical protein